MPGRDLLQSLRAAEPVGRWLDRIAAQLDQQLTSYSRQLDDSGLPGPKAVKDPIWGMIDLDGREVAVLDSPPMQRLRRVRQLGVSYLTYPTAGYSRFEHALGALHQAERMLHAIARRSADNLRSTLLAEVSTVRLAALLHDVGHLPFSHLTERYYTTEECGDEALIDEVDALTSGIGEVLGVKTPSLSECLSLLTILSPPLFDLLTSRCGYEESDVVAAALAIAGRPISPDRTFVMQLVTNAIDADKLDYMFRDSHATGVPIGIDLERMLYKLFCVAVRGSMIPRGLQRLFGNEEDAIVIATDLQGHQLAYDLAAARSILFERIYLHHKTRASERLVLDLVQRTNPHPLDLLATDDGVMGGHGIHAEDPTVLSLLNRSLPRRVFAMSKQYLLKAADLDESGKPRPSAEVEDAWEDLLDDLSTFSLRTELKDAILQEYRQLGELLGVQSECPTIWLEAPPKPYDLGAAELVVRRPNDEVGVEPAFPAKAASYTLNPSDTIFAYTSAVDTSFHLLFIAIELVICSRYRIVLGADAADHAKVDTRQVVDLKRALEQVRDDLFAVDGRLRPPAKYPRSVEGAQRLSAQADRFATYQVRDE